MAVFSFAGTVFPGKWEDREIAQDAAAYTLRLLAGSIEPLKAAVHHPLRGTHFVAGQEIDRSTGIDGDRDVVFLLVLIAEDLLFGDSYAENQNIRMGLPQHGVDGLYLFRILLKAVRR